MKKFYIGMLFVLFVFLGNGCNKNGGPQDHDFNLHDLIHDFEPINPVILPTLFPINNNKPEANGPKKTDVNICLTFAQLFLDNFDTKKYILTNLLDGNPKDTTVVEFSWVTKDNQNEHINCYFKKK